MPTVFIRKAPPIAAKLQKDLDLDRIHACAILGNIGHECAGFVLMQEVHPVAGQGGYGWQQWTGPRRRSFFAFCKAHGFSVDSDEGNYAYLVHELQNDEAASLKALKRETTLAGAVEAFERLNERAGVPAISDRIHWANLALEACIAADKAAAGPVLTPAKPIQPATPTSAPVASSVAPSTPAKPASPSIMQRVLQFLHLQTAS